MTTPQENLALSGIRIVVTRASSQASSLTENLRLLGATVLEVPALQILPPESWHAVDEAIDRIDEYDWIIFASTNAVQFFLDRLNNRRNSLNFPQAIKSRIAAIGPSTADSIIERGFSIHYRPSSSAIAESFVEEFPGYPDLRNQRFLFPRTNKGREYIPQNLRAAGATVTVVETYRTELPSANDPMLLNFVDQLRQGAVDVITLASSQTARNLGDLITAAWAEKEGERILVKDAIGATVVIAIGPETAATAREVFGRCNAQAVEYTANGLVEAILQYYSANTNVRLNRKNADC